MTLTKRDKVVMGVMEKSIQDRFLLRLKIYCKPINWEFPMCVRYVKTFAGVPDYICWFCNCWALLTYSRKSISRMLMYQLANNLKYLISCWISHDFTLKNVLTWFVISRTCEFKMPFRFSLSFIYFSKFSTKI